MDECWQSTALFAAESSIYSTLDSSRHSQVCFTFQQRGNVLPATPEPQKPLTKTSPEFIGLQVLTGFELGSLKSGREFRESQALVYAVGEFGCIGYI